MHKSYTWLAGLFFLIILNACDSKKIYEKYESIPDGIWDADMPVVFEFDINDTLQPCNVYMQFRNHSQYPYQNLYIFLTTTFPSGQIAQDTMEFYFSDQKGKPLGDCSSDICTNRFMIMNAIRFPMQGHYMFQIHQAMRRDDNKLTDILDVGMRIEKTIDNYGKK
ncbi:MAG: gliding motility lipoprotein GldH [Candidatus Competibacteraceae bacterium]|nr:gliding motility lipoprotein GldH [Candidatus Competibacteraceae bacterium]